MSKLNNETKRYQNPELFEQLAIEYAVGSMQGRARKRFEALMDTHFYLRAVVDAYENKFAHLVELIPEAQPSDAVWNKVEAHINSTSTTQVKEEKVAWWKSNFFKQGFGLATMAFIVSAVLLFNPMTPDATAYSAVLESGSSKTVAVTKIQKSDMKLSVDLKMPVQLEDGMELTLWCHPKHGGKPMKMGVISQTGKTEIKISKEEWRSMETVGLLAISVEKKGSGIKTPTGEILIKGMLNITSSH